jgi:hypothetical protein
MRREMRCETSSLDNVQIYETLDRNELALNSVNSEYLG